MGIWALLESIIREAGEGERPPTAALPPSVSKLRRYILGRYDQHTADVIFKAMIQRPGRLVRDVAVKFQDKRLDDLLMNALQDMGAPVQTAVKRNPDLGPFQKVKPHIFTRDIAPEKEPEQPAGKKSGPIDKALKRLKWNKMADPGQFAAWLRAEGDNVTPEQANDILQHYASEAGGKVLQAQRYKDRVVYLYRGAGDVEDEPEPAANGGESGMARLKSYFRGKYARRLPATVQNGLNEMDPKDYVRTIGKLLPQLNDKRLSKLLQWAAREQGVKLPPPGQAEPGSTQKATAPEPEKEPEPRKPRPPEALPATPPEPMSSTGSRFGSSAYDYLARKDALAKMKPSQQAAQAGATKAATRDDRLKQLQIHLWNLSRDYSPDIAEREAKKYGVPIPDTMWIKDTRGNDVPRPKILTADQLDKRTADFKAQNVKNVKDLPAPGANRKAPLAYNKPPFAGTHVGQVWSPNGVSREETVWFGNMATGQFQRMNRLTQPRLTGTEVVWDGSDWIPAGDPSNPAAGTFVWKAMHGKLPKRNEPKAGAPEDPRLPIHMLRGRSKTEPEPEPAWKKFGGWGPRDVGGPEADAFRARQAAKKKPQTSDDQE